MLWAQLPSLVVSVGNADLSRTCSAEQPMQPMPPRSDNFTRRFRRVCSIRSNFTTLIHLWTRVTFSPGGFPLNITIKLTRRSSKHPLSDPWTTAAPADRGRRPKLHRSKAPASPAPGGASCRRQVMDTTESHPDATDKNAMYYMSETTSPTPSCHRRLPWPGNASPDRRGGVPHRRCFVPAFARIRKGSHPGHV